MVREKATTSEVDDDDRRHLVNEIADITFAEKMRIADQITALQHYSPSTANATNYVKHAAMTDLAGALRCYDDLEQFVRNVATTNEEAFVQSMALCGLAIKKAAAARSLLMRHTPTLRGFPSGSDPTQSLAHGRRDYTVDYLRGGYVLFQQPGATPPTRYADHPLLRRECERLTKKLYPTHAELRSLAFTSGIAALDTVLDVMAARSIQTGRINYVGQNCWIELRRRLANRDPQHFRLYADSKPDLAAELICRPEVQSVLVEGIQNHPHMRVCDFPAIDAAARNLATASEKFIIVDNVATFDTDVFQFLGSPETKERLTVVTGISGIKFFQNGSDVAKAGLLSVRLATGADQFFAELLEARAGTGRAPAFEEMFAFGADTRDSLTSRMARYDRNTRHIALALERFSNITNCAVITSPWLSSHPDHHCAIQMHGHGGRFVYVRLVNPADEQGQNTLALYRLLADRAEEAQLPLIAASNFGFAVPHIHVVRHEDVGVSLRVSGGSVNLTQVQRVVEHLTTTIYEFQEQQKRNK